MQSGYPYCISVRTVERELLLRCSSDAEAETWRQAIIGKSSTPLLAASNGDYKNDFQSSTTVSSSTAPSDSLIAEDGDSLDLTGISIGHRLLPDSSVPSSLHSTVSSVGGSIGAIPGWDGKKNSLGCPQPPLTHSSPHRLLSRTPHLTAAVCCCA